MHRLLVTTDVLGGDVAVLSKDTAHHLKVLRPKPGEPVELFDGVGRSRVFRCGASASSPLAADGAISVSPKPEFELTLFACVTKGSRWDWTVEKAVELGVTRIVPVISDRCIVRIDRSERVAKRDRWQRIAEDAARQSDAKWLPEICEAVDFAESLGLVSGCACFVGALTDPPPEAACGGCADATVWGVRGAGRGFHSRGTPVASRNRDAHYVWPYDTPR